MLAACLLALPPAASAAIPATLFQADLSGSVTFQTVESGPVDSFTTTATFPLNATSASTDPADSDLWIATGSAVTHSVAAFSYPDFSDSAPDPNSSLTTTGCGTYELDNNYEPELGVTTGAGGMSLLLDWIGDAIPEGGDTNQNGNANNFPASCPNGEFEIQSPTNSDGEVLFDQPWYAGSDTIRFTFSGVNTSTAKQTLTGTSISQTATAAGQPDGYMGCISNSNETCTDSYPQIAETLTLTRVCTGTVTQEQYGVMGTCGSGPPPPTHRAPSGTRISKAMVSSKHRSASFRFSAVGATAYQCALAAFPRKGHKAPKLEYASCKSPKSYSHLKQGRYEFAVRGFSSTGADPHPATKTFKVG